MKCERCGHEFSSLFALALHMHLVHNASVGSPEGRETAKGEK